MSTAKAKPRGELAKFQTAARRVERMISALAAGHEQARAVFNAVDRLEDRSNKVHEGRAEAQRIAAELRTRLAAAEDAGRIARIASYEGEAARLRAEIREENAREPSHLRELRRARLGVGR